MQAAFERLGVPAAESITPAGWTDVARVLGMDDIDEVTSIVMKKALVACVECLEADHSNAQVLQLLHKAKQDQLEVLKAVMKNRREQQVCVYTIAARLMPLPRSR